MRRGVVYDGDAVATVSAAASAVASLENRVPEATFQKRKWGSFWNLYWCFGSHKNNHRIGHAVLVPENTAVGASDAPADRHPSQPLSIVLPFVAPPSSPASFLPSEPPSESQSPTGLLSITSASANMYSPGGPASIFAIGPYAHETQLVSPPIFSSFTTEPSTAPYTPPAESVQLTTPSSPEVPFARLLEPKLQNVGDDQRYRLSQYEFQSYHLQPGSPVSHLISPCSGISGSGAMSPFPDHEFENGHPFFLEFRSGNPPKLLDLDKIVFRKWESCQASGAVTPDASGVRSCDSCLLRRQYSDISPLPNINIGLQDNDTGVDRRVSFEMIPKEFLKSVEKMTVISSNMDLESVENVESSAEEKSRHIDDSAREILIDPSEKTQTDCIREPHHQKIRSFTLGSSKEFNFDNVDGEARIMTDWWANEQILGEDGTPSKDWSFFPMMQSSVS